MKCPEYRFSLIFRLILLVSSLSSVVNGQQRESNSIDGVYRGSIGNQSVVVEIGSSDVDEHGVTHQLPYWVGRYFYLKFGAPIQLDGLALPDGSVHFQESEPSYGHQAEKITGEWRITFNDGLASGVFCKCDVSQSYPPKESSSPIFLTRISSGFDPRMQWRRDTEAPDQAYYNLLLDFPLQQGTEVHVTDEISYAIWTDSRSKVSLPRLARFPDKRVLEKVNADLIRELNNARLGAHECRWNQLDSVDGYYQNGEHVVVLTRDTLRISRSLKTCNDRLPPAPEILAYDLHTGERLPAH